VVKIKLPPPAWGDGDLLACPPADPRVLPGSEVGAAGRAQANPAGNGDPAAWESGRGGVEEPGLSREAPGESERREEPE